MMLQERLPAPRVRDCLTALQSGAQGLFSALWGSQEINFVQQARPFGLFDKLHFVSPAVGTPDELDPLAKEAPVGALTTSFAWYDAGMQKRHRSSTTGTRSTRSG